jgi:hypothetical protein
VAAVDKKSIEATEVPPSAQVDKDETEENLRADEYSTTSGERTPADESYGGSVTSAERSYYSERSRHSSYYSGDNSRRSSYYSGDGSRRSLYYSGEDSRQSSYRTGEDSQTFYSDEERSFQSYNSTDQSSRERDASDPKQVSVPVLGGDIISQESAKATESQEASPGEPALAMDEIALKSGGEEFQKSSTKSTASMMKYAKEDSQPKAAEDNSALMLAIKEKQDNFQIDDHSRTSGEKTPIGGSIGGSLHSAERSYYSRRSSYYSGSGVDSYRSSYYSGDDSRSYYSDEESSFQSYNSSDFQDDHSEDDQIPTAQEGLEIALEQLALIQENTEKLQDEMIVAKKTEDSKGFLKRLFRGKTKKDEESPSGLLGEESEEVKATSDLVDKDLKDQDQNSQISQSASVSPVEDDDRSRSYYSRSSRSYYSDEQSYYSSAQLYDSRSVYSDERSYHSRESRSSSPSEKMSIGNEIPLDYQTGHSKVAIDECTLGSMIDFSSDESLTRENVDNNGNSSEDDKVTFTLLLDQYASALPELIESPEALDELGNKGEMDIGYRSPVPAFLAVQKDEPVETKEGNSITTDRVNIIIAGAPASGKGTQCEVIKERFGVVHLSTGDMLRAAVATGTHVGKKAEEFMNSGKLVPDDVILEIVSALLYQFSLICILFHQHWFLCFVGKG